MVEISVTTMNQRGPLFQDQLDHSTPKGRLWTIYENCLQSGPPDIHKGLAPPTCIDIFLPVRLESFTSLSSPSTFTYLCRVLLNDEQARSRYLSSSKQVLCSLIRVLGKLEPVATAVAGMKTALLLLYLPSSSIQLFPLVSLSNTLHHILHTIFTSRVNLFMRFTLRVMSFSFFL